MVEPRTESELDLMRKSGRISSLALKKVLENVRPGVTALELDQIAEKEIKKLGGEVAFKKVKGYRWATCITINDRVVHGIPTVREVQAGDLVSIDLGSIYQGWYSDTAWSKVAGEANDNKKFLAIGEEALRLGIKQAVEGKTVGDISEAIQRVVEGAGYSVVRSLVGHGIGRYLHEDPEVPGFGKAGEGLLLQAGITLAIEVIYTSGKPEVVLEQDGWTISTADGSLGGLFEMTVVVGKEEAEVLTDWQKAQ